MANGNAQGAGMMTPPVVNEGAREQIPMEAQASASIVDINAFQQALANLSDESSIVLEQHLTPPVKEAMAELFGREIIGVLKDFGPTEPTVNIPVSVVISAYPSGNVEESVQMMAQDFASKGKQNIPSPPQGGLGGDPMMGSPPTNVPPGPMPTGMV
tara:strand:+ start:28 stop:498 length:471 start_codon:yes stop_codon:yes gene_type:complete